LRRWSRLSAATAALVLLALPMSAQIARDSSVDWLVSAGSEGERYLRVLQVAGLTPLTQWTIRPFSLSEQRRLAQLDSSAPWSDRFHARQVTRGWVRATTPQLSGVLNTTRPYGLNDGAVWAGRGVTLSTSAGLAAALGPLEVVFSPTLFASENAAFPLEPNGYAGVRRFANGRYPDKIDLPQRFGSKPYGQIDPGQSSITVRLVKLSVGASTANEAWGPAIEEPFLLGDNAAGFAHLFVGTDGPISLGPVSVGVRMIAGRLQESSFSPAAFEDRRRTLAAVTAVLGIRQVPGLEIGAARLFEETYPDSGKSLGAILRPLWENLLKARMKAGTNGQDSDTGNQLASAFARWTFPESGVEVYGELGREDHNYDLRDLLLEPDHDLLYSLGFQRVWKKAGAKLLVFRGELLNSRLSHLNRVREQTPPYIHAPVLQGYTQRGQVLGAPGGFGGGAAVLAVDWLAPRGRRTVLWRRLQEEPSTGTSKPVLSHAVSVDWLIFRPRIDLQPELTGVYTLNRPTAGSTFNLRFALAGVAHW
jgi:hypothetical protein